MKCCDICSRPLDRRYIDGKTTYGPWANMCPPCHKEVGVGFGVGRGQEFKREGSRWVKTKG